MHRRMLTRRRLAAAGGLVALVALIAAIAPSAATKAGSAAGNRGPKFTTATAFDVSKPLRDLAKGRKPPSDAPRGEIREEAGAAAIPAPTTNFEGLSNQDNFNIFGFRVNPPDTVGDVGPNNYVEMTNLT